MSLRGFSLLSLVPLLSAPLANQLSFVHCICRCGVSIAHPPYPSSSSPELLPLFKLASCSTSNLTAIATRRGEVRQTHSHILGIQAWARQWSHGANG